MIRSSFREGRSFLVDLPDPLHYLSSSHSMATTLSLPLQSPRCNRVKRAFSPDECPASKRIRNEDRAAKAPEKAAEEPETCKTLPPFALWPDDIVVHLLQFLSLRTLEAFDLTCKRAHFFVQRNLQSLLANLVPPFHEIREIEQLLASRSQVIDTPTRYSFRYMHTLDAYYSYILNIASKANPVQMCPRNILYPDVDFESFPIEHVELFRGSHCHFFARPFLHVLHFWTIFWEYKRVKRVEPVRYREIVAKWAWERYSSREILGVARFNGCYYSRLITTSLNCHRDALRMVLEIYKSRCDRCDIVSTKDGIFAVQLN
jgi:hypothetical protein